MKLNVWDRAAPIQLSSFSFQLILWEWMSWWNEERVDGHCRPTPKSNNQTSSISLMIGLIWLMMAERAKRRNRGGWGCSSFWWVMAAARGRGSAEKKTSRSKPNHQWMKWNQRERSEFIDGIHEMLMKWMKSINERNLSLFDERNGGAVRCPKRAGMESN